MSFKKNKMYSIFRTSILFISCCLLSIVAHAQRAMYIDGFNTIINNATSKNNLLQYAKNQNITYLILYDLHLVHNQHNLTTASTNQILADFIKDAKQNYGISKIAAAGENAWFFQNRIMAYNNTRSLASEKFDVLGMEFEFWTPIFIQPGGTYCVDYLQPNGLSCDSTGAFAFCKSQLQQMKTMTNSSTHPMTVEMYVGWPNAGQLKIIADIVDKTLIHAYVTNPSNAFNYALTRLQYYDTYANIENVSIIYSAEPNFMGPWLTTNNMAAAEQTFMTAYNNSNGNWKSHVNLQSFTYFTYSMMSNISLPIQLIDFKGFILKNNLFLDWKTNNTDKLNHFEIEVSSDGVDFKNIGTISASNEQNYTFYTEYVSTKNTYCRLKMILNDHQFEYSKVIFLTKKEAQIPFFFPNPTTGKLFLSPSSAPFLLVNSLGKIVLKGDETPQNIDMEQLENGLYWLKIGDDVVKIIKI